MHLHPKVPIRIPQRFQKNELSDRVSGINTMGYLREHEIYIGFIFIWIGSYISYSNKILFHLNHFTSEMGDSIFPKIIQLDIFEESRELILERILKLNILRYKRLEFPNSPIHYEIFIGRDVCSQ